MGTTVNWGDLFNTSDEAGFTEMIEVGSYKARITKAEVKKTQGGKDKIEVQFIINGGKYKNTPYKDGFIISPESAVAVGFFLRHMAALGFDRAYFSQKPTLEKLAGDMANRECILDIDIRKWTSTRDGSERESNQIKGVRPITAGTPAPGVQPTSAPQQPVAQPQPAAAPAEPAPEAAEPAPEPAQQSAPAPESPTVPEPSSDGSDSQTIPAPPSMPF